MAANLKFGILDDEGQVVRWVWFKPAHPHVVVKIPKPRKPVLDLSKIPDALF